MPEAARDSSPTHGPLPDSTLPASPWSTTKATPPTRHRLVLDKRPASCRPAGIGLACGYLDARPRPAVAVFADLFVVPAPAGTALVTGGASGRGGRGVVLGYRTRQGEDPRHPRRSPARSRRRRLLDLPWRARAASSLVAGGDGGQALAAITWRRAAAPSWRPAMCAPRSPHGCRPRCFRRRRRASPNSSRATPAEEPTKCWPWPRGVLRKAPRGQRAAAWRTPAKRRPRRAVRGLAGAAGHPDDDFLRPGGHSRYVWPRGWPTGCAKPSLKEVSLADARPCADPASPCRCGWRGAARSPVCVPTTAFRSWRRSPSRSAKLEEQLRGPSAAYHLPLGLKL
ncbi:hypothetical protein ACU686_15560 [Yinghuangia aomiensis]